jgi:nicotinate-nucleotide--dimethylbenzimidazole phosphoribosyltransferase
MSVSGGSEVWRSMRLDEILASIEPLDLDWVERARERTARLVMPFRALGKLHEISEKLCGIQQTLELSVRHKALLVMAGDHGVTAEGVSAYPQEVTREMVKTFLRGGAGINALARHVGAEVWVVDMGISADLDPLSLPGGERLWVRKVGHGTANLALGPAMTRSQAEEAILTGFHLASRLFENGTDVLGTGDMGIGNTTPSTAVATVMTGKGPEDLVGPGTGVDHEGIRRKIDAISRGILVNRPDPRDGLDVLAKIGGFEIGGIAGCILAGAFHRRAVVIDGLISTAGALIAKALCPRVTDYTFAGHRSAEPGHKAMLAHLGLEPILDLGMRLGEGTGAALAMSIIDGAVRVFREVLTFEEAGVPGKDSP